MRKTLWISAFVLLVCIALTGSALCSPADQSTSSDGLVVNPSDGFASSGYEGGPFEPPYKVYTLTNTGQAMIVWKASATQGWLTVSPSVGSLMPGASVGVEASVNTNAFGLAAGEYTDTISFTNVSSGIVQTRGVSLSVIAIPGEISVEDSIPPTDDLDMPFGQLSVGQTRTEQITVRNTSPDYGLTVRRIRLTTGSGSPENVTMGSSTTQSPTARKRRPSLEAEHRPDMLLVGFKPGIMTAARESVHSMMGANRAHSYNRIPVDVVRLPEGSDLEKFIAMYEARPDVAYAEPNYVVRTQSPPNDPRFGELWGLNNTGQTGGTPGADISALEAWEMTTGSNDVIVGVIDTGIDYTHPDLAGNMWLNPNPTFGDVYGARWTNGDGTVTSGNPMDGDSHGTHCAGTIGGVGNNGTGVTGINWNVRLMALKFLSDSGSGYTADAVSALEYAINHGAHLTSNSWGGGGQSQTLEDMINSAADANQLFIAAAGNNDRNIDAYPFYPASYDCPNVIAVAASDHNDQRSIWPEYYAGSNYGPTTVHLAAPGSYILSTVPSNSYDTKCGTSMATPHVSGVAALILSLNPTASYADVKGWIMEGADKLPQWTNLVISGGRLNAAESLRLSSPHFEINGLPDLPATIPPGGSLTFDVRYAPQEVGVHSRTVVIESNDAQTPSTYVTLSGSAVEDFLTITPENGLASSGYVGGPFAPQSMAFSLANVGTGTLNWTVSASADWLTVSPHSGTLAAGGSVSVTVAVNAHANVLPSGTYNDFVSFTNVSSGLVRSRPVTLDIELPVSLIGSIKGMQDGTDAAASGIVTASFPIGGPQSRIYIQSEDRSSGIAVETTTVMQPGSRVRAEGTTSTVAGERVLIASLIDVIQTGTPSPKPISVSNRSLGGGQFGLQPGVLDGSDEGRYSQCANNVGLLAKMWGRVTYVDSGGAFFYMDDGSGIADGSGHKGVRVASQGVPKPSSGSHVLITGISGVTVIDGKVVRMLRPRSASDLSYYTPANRVSNPGFETGTLAGWTVYDNVNGVQSGTWYGNITARSGSYFIGSAAHGLTVSGGVYQRVSATPGLVYQASAWSRVYRMDNPTDSTQNRVGIDPNGGVNPNSTSVIWSNIDMQPISAYSEWRLLETTPVKAAGPYVTIFLDGKQFYNLGWHINCFDDAGLFIR